MRTFIVILFIVMCLAQLAIPGKMIWDSESALRGGTAYKFQTMPIDPYDPFRGKYITLRFQATHIRDSTNNWASGEPVNVVFNTDSAGFAAIDYLTREEPEEPYLRTKVDYVNIGGEVFIRLPFNRFYMEESKAGPTEQYYAEATRDTARVCYALVSIGRGRAVISDVFIDDRSVKDIINDLQ